jgi:FixJ family two-component response regulator
MPLQQTIYVIDDDASVRKALERLLRAAGLSCRVFASGDEFLKDVQPTATGCVIMDISMPEMNGHELQAELGEKGYRLPVITLSAMDNPQTREQARKLGAVSFFRKPVDDQALLDAIHWAMGR